MEKDSKSGIGQISLRIYLSKRICPMKKPKMCTFSFHIQTGEKYVPFEMLSRKDQKKIQETISLGCMDLYMQQLGYQRTDTQQIKDRKIPPSALPPKDPKR